MIEVLHPSPLKSIHIYRNHHILYVLCQFLQINVLQVQVLTNQFTSIDHQFRLYKPAVHTSECHFEAVHQLHHHNQFFDFLNLIIYNTIHTIHLHSIMVKCANDMNKMEVINNETGGAMINVLFKRLCRSSLFQDLSPNITLFYN